ncbi:fructosamine kinase family protein [Aquirufa nivalisilvae]|uniref:fructosamine kinase family protein n=1 Tax=Aquirufa nivalisilvae TaxID=2516557 RepID=UPI001032A2A1|nr:fructosamine kinase family protein [Aquirufa nivalisilvae]TBH76006.1 ketosamine-3-kinase [Aquirufa nivalisilvae]
MSQQSQEQYQFIESILRQNLGEIGTIEDFQFFYGGNFNLAVRVKVAQGEYFIKWNQGDHQGLFQAEAKNLGLIASTGTIPVPQVLGVGQMDEKEYLVMECIPTAEKKENYWSDFGIKLALLHQNNAHQGHGLGYDNFIGAAKQVNHWDKNGVSFFIQNRLKFQVDTASYHRKIDGATNEAFEKLYDKIPSIIPNEQSALLHGDLWSGNAMVNQHGLVSLVDPSCYYGLREAEIAFTTMFGGFEKEFYEAYHESFPILKGFHERIPLYNLYPLMVHVNLFGEGYLPAVNKILDSYLN